MKWRKIIVSLSLLSSSLFILPDSSSVFSQVYHIRELEYELLVASISGDTAKIRMAVRFGADVNIRTDEGITPLLYAVSYNRPEAVNLLLELNADPDLGTLDGANPLLEAIKLQNLPMAEKLIRAGADINHRDINGATALHYASLFGYFYEADMLIYYEAKTDIPASDGTTPLMSAVISGSFDIADILLQYGADVNSIDRIGYTPFLIAAQNGDTLMMELLIMYGASIYVSCNSGYNAVAITIRENHNEAFKYLYKKGNLWHREEENAINPWLIAETYQRRNFTPLLKQAGIKRERSVLIDQVSLDASFLFSANQSFTGFTLRATQPLTGAGLITGIDMKLWDTRVLIEESEWISQYIDRRSVAYAGLFRSYRLNRLPARTEWHISIAAKAGYKFGNRYPGTNLKPEHGFTFLPSATIIGERSGIVTTIGIEYMSTEVYKSGPVWFRVGVGYNYFFNDIRSPGKRIIWR